MSDTKNSETTTQSSWRDKTVKAAGYSYLVGDAALAASGIVKKDKLAATGLIWAAGGVGAAVWGNPDVEKQLEILAHKLEKHLKQNGASVTDSVRENAELLHGKDTLAAKLDRFMHTHPTELLNASYAVGATILGISGFKENKPNYKWMGGLVLAGALSGLLIKEDPDAQSKADPSSIISKTVAWVKEKPMRLSSALYWSGNIFTLKNAVKDMKEPAGRFGIKPHYLSFLTVASYVLANGLLFASSRDQIQEKKFTTEHIGKLEQVAAEIIAAQPPQLQAALLTDISQYLAKEKMIDVTAEELSKQLIARVSDTLKQHLAQAANRSWAARSEAKTQATPSVA